MYVPGNPIEATRIPASAGPTVSWNPVPMPPRALAAGSSSLGTSRGMIADRDVLMTVAATASIAVRA